MTCTNCGADVRPGAMFCGECGARVATGAARPSRGHPALPPEQALIWSSDPIPPTEQTPPAPTSAPRAMTLEDLEATILAPRRRPWTLTGPDGVVHPIRVPTIIGRAPQRPVGRQDIEILPLADPTKSLSKSHAIVELDGAGLTIQDLGSTNGIVIVDGDGVEFMLPVGVRVPVDPGTRFELGDYILHVDRA